ncbi:MAG TPA: acyl-CoA dehydrogenase family protein, partial [Verrucomicrobiae bacterium]|nr:acyl-CoA dehydrogenase family protein [Verrucomicrobiae bacterium]
RKLTGRAAFKALSEAQNQALHSLRVHQPTDDPLARFAQLDSLANVFCPACKLWNTGHGANMMREAVSLMGGYGVTEDCPGFLGQKWMDAQLEATYEGPEAVQRLQLSITMTNELFLTQFEQWTNELKRIASERPGTGACALATAMKLWLWTLNHVRDANDADGARLYHKTRQGVTFPLADALCWLLAARQFILDVIELETAGQTHSTTNEGLAGTVTFLTDLCHVQAARAAGEVGRIAAEIVHGYNRHPAWDDASCRQCYTSDELTALEGVIPGIDGSARSCSDVTEAGEPHAFKAGPCARCEGLEPFVRLRAKLDTCLTGCRLAKDRAADALTKVMVREALDYPA